MMLPRRITAVLVRICVDGAHKIASPLGKLLVKSVEVGSPQQADEFELVLRSQESPPLLKITAENTFYSHQAGPHPIPLMCRLLHDHSVLIQNTFQRPPLNREALRFSGPTYQTRYLCCLGHSFLACEPSAAASSTEATLDWV